MSSLAEAKATRLEVRDDIREEQGRMIYRHVDTDEGIDNETGQMVPNASEDHTVYRVMDDWRAMNVPGTLTVAGASAIFVADAEFDFSDGYTAPKAGDRVLLNPDTVPPSDEKLIVNARVVAEDGNTKLLWLLEAK